MSYETIVTTAGRQALSTAIANSQPLPINSFKVGDGNGSIVTPTASATDIVNACYTGTPARLSVPDSAGNQVAIECVVPASSGGYTVREIGIYSNNTLICYAATPEIEKPLLENGAVGDLVLTVTMTISNADAVTLAVDPGVAVATRQYVDTAENRLNLAITNTERYITEQSQARETALRKLLAYYDGLHIGERLSRLRDIENVPSGMNFKGIAFGRCESDDYVCISYANPAGTDGGVSTTGLSDFGFDNVISGVPCGGVCYGNGVFIVGSKGKIFYSVGTPWSWNDISVTTETLIKKVVYNGEFFVAISDDGVFRITGNGVNIPLSVDAAPLSAYGGIYPLDAAVNLNTGEIYILGMDNGGYMVAVLEKNFENGEYYASPIQAEHIFYSEPCQRLVVWGSGGIQARHPQGWTNLAPNGYSAILGGGLNVFFLSKLVPSGTGGTTSVYYYQAFRRTLEETTVTGSEISTTYALARSELFMFDGLLFALSSGKLMAE